MNNDQLYFYNRGFNDCLAKNLDTNLLNEMTDKGLIIFLMDEIDKASQWLIEGQTHMATGVLGSCHAEIRKHLSK